MINISSFPNQNLIKQLYKKYYTNEMISDSFMSSHWRKYSKEIEVDINETGDLRKFSGCGFGELYHNRFGKMLNCLCNYSYFVRLSQKGELRYLMNLSKPNLKAISSYLSYDCFRQLCSLRLIRKHSDIKESEHFYVMVIGDGYGFLSSVIKRLYPFAKIVLVDIGKVLLFQCVNLQVIFPENLHLGILNGFEISGEFDFLYCPAEDIEKLTGINFKLVVNISSMQEMDMANIERYFDYIRCHVTPDNLFYCCNRKSKVLPGGETINFFDYPWLKEDRHLIDEEPAFYRYFFTGKFPFVRYFDGPMHHRLTNMKTKEDTKTHET